MFNVTFIVAIGNAQEFKTFQRIARLEIPPVKGMVFKGYAARYLIAHSFEIHANGTTIVHMEPITCPVPAYYEDTVKDFFENKWIEIERVD